MVAKPDGEPWKPTLCEDTVTKRLWRWTGNPLGSAHKFSNPFGVDCLSPTPRHPCLLQLRSATPRIDTGAPTKVTRVAALGARTSPTRACYVLSHAARYVRSARTKWSHAGLNRGPYGY